MAHTEDSSERLVSTCPTGSWLDGLRASFDPESSPDVAPTRETGPQQRLGLIAGRLRSA